MESRAAWTLNESTKHGGRGTRRKGRETKTCNMDWAGRLLGKEEDIECRECACVRAFLPRNNDPPFVTCYYRNML